jgi:hypothetical protein
VRNFFISILVFSHLCVLQFCGAREYSLEGRLGYFYPSDHRFRNVYSNGGAIYGLEFNMQAWKRFFLWGEIDYFSKSGKTDKDFGSIINTTLACTLNTCQHDHTHIRIVPCSVGLKYYFNKDPVQFYLGAGVLAAYLHTHVDSASLVSRRSKWGGGGAFKSGLLCKLGKSFLVDFFADYYLIKADLHQSHNKNVITHHTDISGFLFGGAFGYIF